MTRDGINYFMRAYLKLRYRQLWKSTLQPSAVQQNQWYQLLQKARLTTWGKNWGMPQIRNTEDYKKAIPLSEYEDLKPFIERMMHGEPDVLWPGKVTRFSKSSGTTGSKSKFIPVTPQNLRQTHIRGAWDAMALIYRARPDARNFADKSMLMGGSLSRFEPYPKTLVGDVSAIMISNMPRIGRPFFIPDLETALMADWELKLELLAQAGAKEKKVVMIGGVPTWTVVLFRRILEITGKSNMHEVWPHFQVYSHGGVSFTPYRTQFDLLFPGAGVCYQEVYNASEGFFAVQDDLQHEGMLLLLNHGIFYEFIPMEEWGKPQPHTLAIQEVETGKQYAIVISTNSGLWRYLPGDTITFVSLRPYRIKVTGRTKQYINTFGEEVIVDNTDQALALTCTRHCAIVRDYTVAPVFLSGNTRGGHEWLIEFEKPPADLSAFAQQLDQNLQDINSDYEAKRYRSIALAPLKIKALPPGAFLQWMKARGKLGGQHKVPRLSNSRSTVEDILSYFVPSR
ncbi:MAG: GH3 auxin-responsive promoter family protein [Saprospiraceae bacterium]|jgi:hypothetical protein